MDLLDQFYDVFPEANVAYLTGDREFVGKQWLTYLSRRVSSSTNIDHSKSKNMED